MSTAAFWRGSLRKLGHALRRPEQAALAWHKQAQEGQNDATIEAMEKESTTLAWSAFQGASPSVPQTSRVLFVVLFMHAVLGMAAYGLTLQMQSGPLAMLKNAWLMPVTIGLSWCLAFPSLYIINTALGSRLHFSTTLLATLLTLSIGALAMLTLVPIHMFFSITLPMPEQRWIVHIASLVLVGICMTDVFLRVMRSLEPKQSPLYAMVWILLVGFISVEMSALVKLLNAPT